MDPPLLEDDLDEPGIIEARLLHRRGPAVPVAAVVSFFNDLLTRLAREGELRPVYELRSEIGVNPVYVFESGGGPVTVVHPGVGAPLATGVVEEIIALGVTTLVACGGTGALVDELTLGQVMVVESALRDEGTSLHYAPPSRVIQAERRAVASVSDVLTRRGVPHVVGRTWTTDAFRRETRGRVARRAAEGCQMVDVTSRTAKSRPLLLRPLVRPEGPVRP